MQWGRSGLDPWVGKIPWRRARQPTPVFLPGKSHGQRRLVDVVVKTWTWLRDWALSTYQLLDGSSFEVLLLSPVSPRKAGLEKVKSAALVPLGSQSLGISAGRLRYTHCLASRERSYHFTSGHREVTAWPFLCLWLLYSYSLRGHVFLLTAWFTYLHKINAILGHLISSKLACSLPKKLIDSILNVEHNKGSRELKPVFLGRIICGRKDLN